MHKIKKDDMIEKQIIAVFEDIEVHAVKVGMLSTRAGMLAVSKMLKQYRPKHVVIDPVMVAKGGCALMQEEALSTLIEEMIPHYEWIEKDGTVLRNSPGTYNLEKYLKKRFGNKD